MVLKKDYRDLTGQYDKLVSIEMIEAVGHHFLDTYVNTLSTTQARRPCSDSSNYNCRAAVPNRCK